MHVCNENMNDMLVLKFPKQKIYIFQKVFDFSEFSKSLKILGCYILPPLKGISSRESKRLEGMGLKTLGFVNWVATTLKRNFCW